ncbi:MAG: 3-deoxy-D-manno-octulosonic acid transferase [Xanthomonadales bacterium]|nr:3-deoxy-D-manno-octulosonic acid transferase [Xanthomonadales bacterium]
MLAVYRAVVVGLLPLALVYLVWRSRREPAYRHHLSERLGRIAARSDRPVWLHAASVGEVQLAVALIHRLRELSNAPIVLTTMTPTGRETARRALGETAAVMYLALDTRAATQRFVTRIRPRCAIVIETELWPNLLDTLARAAIPTALINASVSQRSAGRYDSAVLRGLVRYTLQGIDLIAAASPADKARFAALGAADAALKTLGQIKYDLAADDTHGRAKSTPGRSSSARPVIVAGSTRDDEEARWLSCFAEIRTHHPEAMLVIAPRHPQRFDSVARELAAGPWRWVRFSQHGFDAAADIVLVDTLGALGQLYHRADIAFVGGTLVPGIGGHNVIEPAAAGCVVVTGPHVDSWADIMAPWCRDGRAAIVDDEAALVCQVVDWLADRAQCSALGRANADQVAEARGALAASVDALTAAGFLALDRPARSSPSERV